jgi:hypothetical protein
MAIVFTAHAESAQAIFCYIADILGATETSKQFRPYLEQQKVRVTYDFGAEPQSHFGPTYDVEYFFKEYKDLIDEGFKTKRIKVRGAKGKSLSKQSIIKYVKSNKQWFISSLRIAEYILVNTSKINSQFAKIENIDWQDLYYVRGDKAVMATMAELYALASATYKKANGQKAFGDVNKWSPADMYFASNLSKSHFKKLLKDYTKSGGLDFAVLNEHIADKIDSADLLPLSLKLVSDTVKLEKVNFDRVAEDKLLSKTKAVNKPADYKLGQGVYTIDPFIWTTDWFNMRNGKRKSKGGRDIYIPIISGGLKGRLQFRHLPTSGGRPTTGISVSLSYDSSSALGGKVGSPVLLKRLIAAADEPFANELMKTWDEGMVKYVIAANSYIKTGGGAALYKLGDKRDQSGVRYRTLFDDDIGAISAITVMNPFRKKLAEYFKGPKTKQHNVIQQIFRYVASRSLESSRFVIVKD